MRNFFTASALLLTLTGSALAATWSHRGTVWTDGPLRITLPASLKVSEDKGVLNAASGDGLIVTVSCAHTKDEVKQVLTAADQVVHQMHVQMGPYKSGSHNGVDVNYEEGQCSMNDVPIKVTLAVFSRKNEYLVCQVLLAGPVSAKYTPMMKSVFGSIASGK